MEAFANLAAAVLTLAATYGLGSFCLSWLNPPVTRWERPFLGLLLGAPIIHLLIFAILALQVAYPAVFVILLVIGCGAGMFGHRLSTLREQPPFTKSTQRFLLAIGFGALWFFILYFVHAWAPERSPDGSSYHLGLVARYLRAHGFEQVPTNLYAQLSGGFDLLFVPAFALGGHSAAALVHLGFLTAGAWGMFTYGVRIGNPLVGAVAALLFFASPIVGVEGAAAYVDDAAAAAAWAVFYLLEVWDDRRDSKLLAAVGLMAGYCYAIKYTVFAIGLYAVGFVLSKATRRLAHAAIVIGLASLMITPWAAKNWVYAGNPIAPLGNNLFPNPYVTKKFEETWRRNMATADGTITSYWDLPLEVTYRGTKTGGAIGVVYLLGPLGLLSLRRRTGRRLLVCFSLLAAGYFANVGARFLIPSLPFLSFAMALAVESVPALAVGIVAMHALLCWPSNLHRLGPQYWSLKHFPIRAALRLQPEADYLSESPEYRRARLVERVVPAGGRVLGLGELADAYTTRDILTYYKGALNQELTELLLMGEREDDAVTRTLSFRFSRQPIRALRLVQTATVNHVDDEWNVQELRFFNDNREIQRQSGWRWDANPFPWNVGNAHDGILLTSWQPRETAAPGQYLEVDFGDRAVVIDEVQLSTVDSWSARFKIQVRPAGGDWSPLASTGQMQPSGTVDDIGHQIATGFRRHGVGYVLVMDSSAVAGQLARRPERFGCQLMIHEGDAAIYQIVR